MIGKFNNKTKSLFKKIQSEFITAWRCLNCHIIVVVKSFSDKKAFAKTTRRLVLPIIYSVVPPRPTLR